jgi:two-component sensor histidine kinase
VVRRDCALAADGREIPVSQVIIAQGEIDRKGGYLGTVARDISVRKEAEERQRLLLAELNHQAKNTIAIIDAIASRSFTAQRSIEDGLDVFRKRLAALSGAHDLLTASEWRSANLRTVIATELSAYGRRASLDGPEIALAPKAALTLALVLHELATNAGKYGALSTPEGHVNVSWALGARAGGSQLRLRWRESDGSPGGIAAAQRLRGAPD